MGTKISRAAAIAIAASAFTVAGCQTAPEERPSASAASTDASPRAGASDSDKPESAGATGAATTGEQRPAESGQASTSAPTSATPYEITGRVESVDASSIAIAGKTLKVDTSTSVMKGGVGASLDDIQEGDEVRASLSGSGDPLKAERIEVIAPATDAPASGTPGTSR